MFLENEHPTVAEIEVALKRLLADKRYSKQILEMVKSEGSFIGKSTEEMIAWSDKFKASLEELVQKSDPSNKEIENVIAQYLKLPQSTHTNSLAHKLTTRISNPAQLDLNGRGTIADKDFKLYIEGYDRLVNGANTSAVKFFDAAVMNCSKNHDSLARIPLNEYMELRGLKDEKEARKQIKSDMEVLKAIKFDYKGTGKRKSDWLSISLYGGRDGIYKGVIEFMFSKDFYASIPENQFMFMPREYFSTRDKYNPHTSYFIRRIAEHKRMNLGKTNENIIGVETLINSSPLFPKYEDVKYRFTQFILTPFEKDMDVIKSIKWHYSGEQPTSYNEFIDSSVVITWVDYPDVGKLTQRKKLPPKEVKRTPKRPKKEG